MLVSHDSPDPATPTSVLLWLEAGRQQHEAEAGAQREAQEFRTALLLARTQLVVTLSVLRRSGHFEFERAAIVHTLAAIQPAALSAQAREVLG